MNRYLAAALIVYVNEHQDDWDQYLEALAFAYRTSFLEAIGNTPFYLVNGRDPRLPTDVSSSTPHDLEVDVHQYGLSLTQYIKDAHTAARHAQDKSDVSRKRYCDATYRIVHFDEGSLVLLHLPSRQPGRSPKLSPRYQGPYRVIRRLSDVLYKISHLKTGAVTTIHVQRLQQYIPLEPPVAVPSRPILLHDDSNSDTESRSSADVPARSTAATVSSARPVRSTAGIPAQRFADL